MHLEIENIHHPQIKNMNLSVYDVGYRAAHLHPEIELILVLKGDPAFNINGNTTSFSEKDIILINANELHEIISRKRRPPCSPFIFFHSILKDIFHR